MLYGLGEKPLTLDDIQTLRDHPKILVAVPLVSLDSEESSRDESIAAMYLHVGQKRVVACYDEEILEWSTLAVNGESSRFFLTRTDVEEWIIGRGTASKDELYWYESDGDEYPEFSTETAGE